VKKRLVSIFRDLTGRSEHRLVELLDRQLDAALRGADLVRRALDEQMPPAQLRDQMNSIENEGDAVRNELVNELSSALTTPVDREDMFRLSRAIDDVVDNLQDFARELDLYDTHDRGRFGPLVEALATGLMNLRIAVLGISGNPGQITKLCLAAKKAGNQVRRMHQDELSALFAGEFRMETLKQRELLRRLDLAGMLVSDAADVLADAAMKRSW